MVAGAAWDTSRPENKQTKHEIYKNFLKFLNKCMGNNWPSLTNEGRKILILKSTCNTEGLYLKFNLSLPCDVSFNHKIRIVVPWIGCVGMTLDC